MSGDKWIGLIQAAVLYDNVVADKVYESKGEDDFLLGQQVEEESSTIGSEIDEGKEDATFDFKWEAPLDDLETDWASTASAHCKALELLGRFLISTTKLTAGEF